MARTVLAGMVAAVLATVPAAVAQPNLEQSPPSRVDQSLIGLPLVSSDGKSIGQVTHVGVDDGQAVLIAEIDRPLGIGADPVAIPAEMFVNRGDHVELTMTAAQIRAKLDRSKR